MMTIRSKTVAAVAALASLIAVAACNTIEGVGEDVSSVGGAVDEAAESAE